MYQVWDGSSERYRTQANLREALRGELAAISDYDRFAREADTPEMRDLFRHISNEERHHVSEEYQALLMIDPEQAKAHREVFGGARPGREPHAAQERVFTLNELAQFNGKDGRPAYVAVEGVVYDVTNNRAWPMGLHNGHMAGRDLTIFFRSRHDLPVLQRLPRVGTLRVGQ